MLPNTTRRVEEHTDQDINERISRQIEDNVAQYSQQDRDQLSRRIRELDQEWDIERTLEANAASLSLVGLGLGAFVDRRFFILPTLVVGFLLQHAVQGWCPPVPLFRQLAFRTAREIETERYALKTIRGDFDNLSQRDSANGDVAQIMEAVRR